MICCLPLSIEDYNNDCQQPLPTPPFVLSTGGNPRSVIPFPVSSVDEHNHHKNMVDHIVLSPPDTTSLKGLPIRVNDNFIAERENSILARDSTTSQNTNNNNNNDANSTNSRSMNRTDSSSTATSESSNSDGLGQLLERQDQDQDQDDSVSQLPPPMPRRTSLVRLMSSCSVGSEAPSCPICLDPMTPMDHEHPLQCPTPHCHFNFCASCIHSLLSSSKDDYEMASDGNAHVKIYLNCPNCRADLSTTIRDVLLLRKVDTVEWLLQRNSSVSGTFSNGVNVLNASQQRTQRAMQELHVQEAIQQARAREKEFWRTHHRSSSDLLGGDGGDDKETSLCSSRRMSISSWRLPEESAPRDDSTNGEEEWGVEADLVNGIHASFRAPPGFRLQVSESSITSSMTQLPAACSPSPPTSSSHYSPAHHKSHGHGNKKKNEMKIDDTLLQGLEQCMTHAEQLQVTHWMTSGDPDQLAMAAKTFQKIDLDARSGIMPSDRQKQMNRRGSVYEIVEETRQVHEKESMDPSNAPPPTVFPRQRNRQQQLAVERRQFELAMMEKASLLERCPLPVRLPKAATVSLRPAPTSRFFPLRFCPDVWDGTVLDAYTKLTITASRRGGAAVEKFVSMTTPPSSSSSLGGGQEAPASPWRVTKKAQTQHPGVFHVLSQGKYQHHYGQVELAELGKQPGRILIASVQGAAGRQGVMKGDVVTHMDGERVPDTWTVEDLIGAMTAKQQAGQAEVEMVLNAEASIAEALKRRACVIE